MTRTVRLQLVHTSIRLEVADEAAAALDPVLHFFRHAVVSTNRADGAALGVEQFVIEVRPYHRNLAERLTEGGAPVVIRRSSAAPFNFDAHRVERDGRRIYANAHTVLDAPACCDAGRGKFVLHVSEGSSFQVIDFLRDLVLRAEEDRGTVILHAAGVVRDGRALAIVGPKGAGKTTTLLALVADEKSAYFTGDKLFCDLVDGRLAAHPWRDWPYVGVGTMRVHDWLAERVRDAVDPDLDSRSPREKLLLDPDEFERALGGGFTPAPLPLGVIVVPEVRPDEPCRIAPVEDEAERWAVLNQVLERTSDTTFFPWQTYLVPDYAALFANFRLLRRSLTAVPMVRITGVITAAVASALFGMQFW